MTILYPVSLRKIWIILNNLPSHLTKKELYNRVREMTSEASYRTYVRALINLNFASGEKSITIRKPINYIEFSRHIYELLRREYNQILQAISDFNRLGMGFNLSTLIRYLQDKNIIISKYKLSLLFRYLNAIGALNKKINIYLENEISNKKIISNMLLIYGSIRLQGFIEKLNIMYFIQPENSLRIILELINKKEINIEGNSKIVEFLQELSDLKSVDIKSINDDIRIECDKTLTRKISNLAKKIKGVQVNKNMIKINKNVLQEVEIYMKKW